MSTQKVSYRIMSGIAALAAFAVPGSTQGAQTDPAPGAQRYLRMASSGDLEQLQIAIRELRPKASANGPSIYLVGAAHIGSAEFYDRLQTFLDSLDLTLFEGVGGDHGTDEPSGAATSQEEDNQQAVVRTQQRMRELQRLLLAYDEQEGLTSGNWADDLERLQAFQTEQEWPSVNELFVDGWDQPFQRNFPNNDTSLRPWTLISFGADGQPGGRGPAQDHLVSGPPEFHVESSGDRDGIQQQLANALGLVFQLNVIDSGRSTWRNCDMTLPQLQKELAEAGVDPKQLIGMLDGSSLGAKFASKILGWLGSSESGSGMLRLVGIELLSRADELLTAAPGELGTMMEVLLLERNAVVIDELKALCAQPADQRPGSIGVFYGAGHLLPMEERLVTELGYEVGQTAWLTAMEVDLTKVGLPRTQVNLLRKMIGRQLDMQLAASKRMKEREEAQAAPKQRKL